MVIRKPYLLFVADEAGSNASKTARGLLDWAPDDCLGQWRPWNGAADLGLPDLPPAAAREQGAGSLLIGSAPTGGQLPAEWIPLLVEALESGLDLVSGLHTRLAMIPQIAKTAADRGRLLHDVRHPSRDFPLATGLKRTGKRALMVGTDCALGKKYTALALALILKSRGVDADFRATGQTGIMISGAGVAIDAVVADFIAGAAEALSPHAAADHWDIIEGQGAIFHPAYAGVTLGLLHGSQPDALILCHDPRRATINGFPDCPIRPLAETMDIYRTLAQVTNKEARFVAISLNTGGLEDRVAREAALEIERHHNLICFDPLRFGIERVASLLESF